MKLYNTLSRQLEDFTPQEDSKVSIYSCGPTVYDHLHIGNLSGFIAADTLRRVLQANGLSVKHVMNITDIDDKTIARSADQFPDDEPETALKNLTGHYTETFMNDLKAIGFNVEAMTFTNATDNIADMQRLITELYEQKLAYITEDGVYFSIKAYQAEGKKYGQLSPITVDNTSQARIRNDEYDKESVHDFALWKIKSGNEPSWEFELDSHQLAGRPGWHIECSAMSVKNLGQPFDIHTGGVDLIFPHHENEIAQSTATNDEKYANYFVHNEHLLVDGRKMSKSLNNFFTLRDIVEKKFDPLAFRLMVLQSHYRSQSNFTWENLTASQNKLHDFRAWSDLQFQSRQSEYLQTNYKEAIRLINVELSNDLHTPNALAIFNGMVNRIEELGIDSQAIAEASADLDALFGLNLSMREDISKDQQNLIAERDKARADNDWTKADQLRQQLEEQDIGLKDTEHGAIWFRL